MDAWSCMVGGMHIACLDLHDCMVGGVPFYLGCRCPLGQAFCLSCSRPPCFPLHLDPDMALTNEVKDEIGRILESDEGVNVRIHKLFKLFLDNALARHETVPPSLVLCHPSNRGGAMLTQTPGRIQKVDPLMGVPTKYP